MKEQKERLTEVLMDAAKLKEEEEGIEGRKKEERGKERLIKVLADAAAFLEEESRGYLGAATTIERSDKKYQAALNRAVAADSLVDRLNDERTLLEAPGALEEHGGP